MKIFTKFITSSVCFAGFIAIVVVGTSFWRNQVSETANLKLEKSGRAIEAALKLEIDLKNEIDALKDDVLLDNKKSNLEKYQNQFLADLYRLETLIPNTKEIAQIRRSHSFLVSLSEEMRNHGHVLSDASLTDYQQDFRLINALAKDINLLLNQLTDSTHKKIAVIEADMDKTSHTSQLLSYAIVITILLVFISQFFLIMLPLIHSLDKLQKGASAIGAGKLDYRLNICTKDELEQLADEFNCMAEKLTESYTEILERSQELTKLNYNLQHEIGDRTQAQAELQKTLDELKSTQAQLIQTEKMSSLGQMVAGVAHEINNPVSFVYGNINHVNEYIKDILELIELYQQQFPNPGDEIEEKLDEMELDFVKEDLPKILISMKMGANRIREIVLSLRNFSRLDEADMKEVDIHEGIESTLLILQNRIKSKPNRIGIEVFKNYSQLPYIECYPGQLNQAFMNIINNAIDVLEEERDIDTQTPQIHIHTELIDNKTAVVRIIDNGKGMNQQVKNKLFDPFFTTKPVGKGTGLGLSITYQIIVDKHQGQLHCVSEPGEGTEFIIQIPLHQREKKEVRNEELGIKS
ncbi:sensor histidine kinase [Rivularia sp. UHCC 0363]|uniref:sensor histidine kinase n=1 Tax=Rivularia sp. UHCC 0363 TaxID=3110244 RepID=UPI002B21C6E6|nr:ATP-binding protein [Rivularia sp. UHCC 0363]MEA5595046.1 ATP-binding protein [Rivularia sp. UHCC 0363]